MKNVFYLSGFGYNKRVEKKESVRITACIFQQNICMYFLISEDAAAFKRGGDISCRKIH